MRQIVLSLRGNSSWQSRRSVTRIHYFPPPLSQTGWWSNASGACMKSLLIVLGLMIAVPALTQQSDNKPDWRAAIATAQKQIEAGQFDAATESVEQAFDYAVQFSPLDERSGVTLGVIQQLAVGLGGDSPAAEALLTRLLERVPPGKEYRGIAGWLLVGEVERLLASGEYDAARSLANNILDAEEAVFGVAGPMREFMMPRLIVEAAKKGDADLSIELAEKFHSDVVDAAGPTSDISLSAANVLANAYGNNGEDERALEVIEKALDAVDSDDDASRSSKVLDLRSRYAELLYYASHYQRALDEYRIVETLNAAAGDTRQQALTLATINRIALQLGNVEVAVEAAMKTFALGETLENPEDIIGASTPLLRIYLQAGFEQEAEAVASRIVQVFEEADFDSVEPIRLQINEIRDAGFAKQAQDFIDRYSSESREDGELDRWEANTLAYYFGTGQRPQLNRELLAVLLEDLDSAGEVNRTNDWLADTAAVHLRLDGRLQQALDLHEQVARIYEENAPKGVWLDDRHQNHADTLRALGREKEARAIEAQLADQAQQLAQSVGAYEVPAYEFPEYNFKLREPVRYWREIDSVKLTGQASLVAFAGGEGVPQILLVNAEPSVFQSAAAYTDVVLARFESLSTSSSLVERTPKRFGDVDGEIVVMDATIQNRDFRYVAWLGQRNSTAYSFISWSLANYNDDLVPNLESLLAGFAVMNPDDLGVQITEDKDAVKLGYTIGKLGPNWYPWRGIEEFIEHADSGYISDSGSALVVGALLNSGGEFSESEAEQVLVSSFSNLEGADENGEFSFSAAEDGIVFQYQGFVKHTKGASYIVIGWADSADPRAEEHLAKAIEKVDIDSRASLPKLEELSSRQRFAQAALWNYLGVGRLERGTIDSAAEALRVAIRLDQDNGLYYENQAYALLQLNEYEEMVELLKEAPSDYVDVGTLYAYRAFAHQMSDRPKKAIEDYELAFAANLQDEDFAHEYIGTLLAEGRIAEAEGVLSAFSGWLSAVSRLRYQTQVAGARGDEVESGKALGELVNYGLAQPEDAYSVADAMANLGETDKLLQFVTSLESSGSEFSGSVYASLAEALMTEGRYADANDALERGLQRDPLNDDLVAQLDRVQALAGQGDNSLIRTEVEPVPLNASFKAMQAENAQGDLHPSLFYLSYTESIHVGKSKVRRTTRFKIKAVDKAGADMLTSLQFNIAPSEESVFVNSLVVRDASGAVVSTGSIDDYYVLSAGAERTADDASTLHVPVNGLGPGHTVEVVLTRQSSLSNWGYFDHTLASQWPTAFAGVGLSGEIRALRYQTSGTIETNETKEGISFFARNPAPMVQEPYTATQQSRVPRVRLGKHDATWERLAKDYLTELSPLLEADVAPELLGSSAEDTGAFVRDLLSYRAVSFGRRAMIPDPVETILKNRTGDCKDHSLLLHHALKARGETSYLALVSTVEEVDPAIPSLEQFDHMIVFCASCGEKGQFLDATDKHTSTGRYAPVGLGGRSALILDSNRPRFLKIPAYSPTSHGVDIQRQVTIEPSGEIHVAETATLLGHYGIGIRAQLKSATEQERPSILQNSVFGSRLGYEIRDVEITGINSPDEPLQIQWTYLPDYDFASLEGTLIGRLPISWERYFVEVPTVEPRRTDFEIYYPMALSSEVSVAFPSGWSVVAPKVGADSLDGRFFDLDTVGESSQDSRIVFKHEVSRGAGAHEADSYHRFAEESRDTLKRLEQTVSGRQDTVAAIPNR